MNLLPLWVRRRLWPCAPIRRRFTGVRLVVEALEDRQLPSTTPASDPAYALWRQQTFHIDDAAQVATATPVATVQAAGTLSNASFGANIGLNQVLAGTPYKGDGYSVAVIDTGINYSDPNLGGGWGRRVIAGWDFVNNDADPMDDNGHGTFVASEIGSSSATYSGVAPDVNLIALKVLDSTGSGNYGNVQSALDWVIAHQAQYHIVAVNLSLGSGNYAINPYSYLESEFSTLKSEGVFIAAAAGNDYYSNGSTPGLAYPAISANVVSVGAVWDGYFGSVAWASGARDYTSAPDQIASFSQRGPALDLLAPGAIITGDGLNGNLMTMAGTSMATPVVAGAAVLLHQALDDHGMSANANETYILQLMQATGKLIVDLNTGTDNVGHTGLSFRRLDLYAAMTALGPVNRGPAISALADQTVHMGRSITNTVTVTDTNGTPTWNAQVFSAAQDAAYLQQQYGLIFTGDYLTNANGLGEQWLWSTKFGGVAVCILADGSVRRYDPAGPAAILSDRNLLGRVDLAYYVNPVALCPGGSAPASTASPAWIGISGNQLTITPVTGYLGSVFVVVTASDATLTAQRTYVVGVTDNPPALAAINDQNIAAGQQGFVNVPISDPDGDPVTWSTQILSPQQDAYAVVQQLRIVYSGNWYQNLNGMNEKWFYSYAFGGIAVCILPDGSIRRYDAGGAAAMLSDASFLGRVDPSYYTNPLALVSVPAPASNVPPAIYSVSGSLLTITPNAGYTGSFYVEIVASDGAMSTKRTVLVKVR